MGIENLGERELDAMREDCKEEVGNCDDILAAGDIAASPATRNRN